MLRVRSPQDLGAALVFIVIGLAGLYFGKDLTFGTASQMGPGFFPTWLNFLILAIGVGIGVKALATEGPPIERFQLRPILFIVAGYCGFWLSDQCSRSGTVRGAHDDLRGLRAAQREGDRNNLACRRARRFQRGPVCLRARTGGARLVGSVRWSLIFSTIWQLASARQPRSAILVLPSSAVS